MSAYKWQPGITPSIEIANAKLETACFGPPPSEAPTIVLLHEGLGCVELWRSFPEALARESGCGVFAWSRAGYGASSPVELPRPLDYMNTEATDVLPHVFDLVEIKKCVLLGHSDGASIAAINAGTCADFRVRALVLMAPHFFAEPESVVSIREARHQFEQGDLRDKLKRYHRDVDNAFYGWCDAWLNDDFINWNIAENIDYIRVPVLAVQGADDQYGTVSQIEALQKRCYAPVETLIIDDCKHSPHIEHEGVVLEAVCEFVTRLRAQENI